MDEPYIRVNEPQTAPCSARQRLDRAAAVGEHYNLYAGRRTSLQGRHFSMPLQNTYQYQAVLEFEVLAEQFTSNKIDILIDVAISGRHTFGVVKASLYPAG